MAVREWEEKGRIPVSRVSTVHRLPGLCRHSARAIRQLSNARPLLGRGAREDSREKRSPGRAAKSRERVREREPGNNSP